MTNAADRYLVANYGPKREPIEAALVLAEKTAQQAGIGEVVLLVSAKKTLSQTVIGTTLGDSVCRALLADKRVSLGGGAVQMSLQSDATFDRFSYPDAVLAIYPSAKAFDLIDDIPTLKLAIVVPWQDADAANWRGTWNPTVVGDLPSQPATTFNAQLEAALQLITGHINVETGLTHPSDKRFAKSEISKLKRRGIPMDHDAVRNWAVRNGWHPKDATDLAKLCAKPPTK